MDALLVCAALLLSFVEAVFPIAALPIPGFKMGLPNIAILYCAFALSVPDAFAVSLARSLLVFLFFGSPTSLLFSLMGGAMVLLGLAILKVSCLAYRFSFVGISVLSASLHNMGQLLAAFLLTGSAVLGYFPALILASLIYGTLTGVILNALPVRLFSACR